jgi:biotin operon repressor
MIDSFIDNFNVKENSNKLKVAILDNMDLVYSGETLSNKGLGGSETAIINMAEELVKLGFDVYVFNNNPQESVFNGVQYHYRWATDSQYQRFDIFISSRSFLPLIPDMYKFDI